MLTKKVLENVHRFTVLDNLHFDIFNQYCYQITARYITFFSVLMLNFNPDIEATVFNIAFAFIGIYH